MSCSFVVAVVEFLFHNHKLNSAIHQDLECDEEKWNPKNCSVNAKIIGSYKQTGMRGALLSNRWNGLAVKIKCKSNLLGVHSGQW